MAVNLGTRPGLMLQRRWKAPETEQEVGGRRCAGGRRSRLGWFLLLTVAVVVVLIRELPEEIPYPPPAAVTAVRDGIHRAAASKTAFQPTSAPADIALEERGRQESQPQIWIVARGETLWSIARTLAPDRDPRSVVESLRRANRLESAALRVGQALQIPPEFRAP